MALSTNDADKLSALIRKEPDMNLFLRIMNGEQRTVNSEQGTVNNEQPITRYEKRETSNEQRETYSHNVIGEIRGTEYPEEVIVVGGHLDCWDNGQGAHDDGAGIVQTMEVLRLFKVLNIQPKRTIRFVAFMDEEMDQGGAKAYATYAKTRNETRDTRNEKPFAAIEADRGGSTPFGFDIDATDTQFEKIRNWKDLLLPYGLYHFEKGGTGVDIRDLKPLGTALMALVTDSQRYFDYHHSANDSFDKIHPRELQLGSFSIAALVYLIDQYGL